MSVRTLTAVALLALAGPFAATAAAESPKDRARRLLDDTGRAKAVLLFLHFGSSLDGHSFNRSGGVNNRPGHFYMEYEYNWRVGSDKGSTTLSFFFDGNGVFQGVQVDKTDAQFNQPFALANLSIKVLGEAVYEALKNKMTDDQRRTLRRLIDDANSKKMLEFLLLIDLAASR